MLDRFVKDYAARGYTFALRLCGNREEAKDLVQDAFLRLITRWERYNPALPLENWFFTILRHIYYDSLKRFDRRHVVSLDMPSQFMDTEGECVREGLSAADTLADKREQTLTERLERRELGACVHKALDALRPEYKAILILSDMQGLAYAQIAVVLDCPRNAVRARVFRAREAFKMQLLSMSEVDIDEL